MKKLTFDESRNRMLNTLCELDSFCKKNNIEYMLSYGTLIGAIRHKGFIPWDDDLDVMMTWENYKKICDLYPSNQDFKLVTIDTDDRCTVPFARLYDMNTGSYVKGREYLGISIDIYPLHNYSNKYAKEILPKMQKLIKKRYWFSRIMRGFDLIKLHFIASIIWQVLQRYIKQLKELTELSANQLPDKGALLVPFSEDKPIEKEWVDSTVNVEFEGAFYPAPIEWDSFLRTYYSDYMQLPPEEDRHPYHNEGFFLKD